MQQLIGVVVRKPQQLRFRSERTSSMLPSQASSSDKTSEQDAQYRLDRFALSASEEDIAQYLPGSLGEARRLEAHDGIKRDRAWARYQHAHAMVTASRKR